MNIDATMAVIALTGLALSFYWLFTADTKPAHRRVDIVVDLGDVKKLADAFRGTDDAQTLQLPVCHEYEPHYGPLGCWCGQHRSAPQHFRSV